MTAIASVRIRNYRCFSDHTIDLGRSTILVGKNNAGKSTLIEALRLAAVALRRFQNPVATQAPRWLDDHAPGSGQRLDLSRMGISTSTLFHRYDDPPAIIEVAFKDGSRLVLYVGEEVAHAVFYNAQGRAVRARRDLNGATTPSIAILPQITPLEREERVLNEDYVRQSMDSNLASRHFRNQLQLNRDQLFENFRRIVTESWQGIRIESLNIVDGDREKILQLMIRDGNFVAEAGWMGHGLQMWIQTLWFISRSKAGGTIVLDEPDVYMHPDLQRKLVRILRSQQSELLIATHSTEIMAEVDAASVLILDRTLQRSSYATDLPAVQRVVEAMGSAQNLQIARLWKSKSLILVEGDDMKLLKRIHDLVCPDSAASLDATPNWSIGGWSGWQNAIGTVAALKNSIDERIRCYCIFDSDYHLDNEIEERRARAKSNQIELHIHSMKEIENFLVIPSLIRRVIERNVVTTKPIPTEKDIQDAISRIVEEMLPEVQDRFVSELLNVDRSAGAATASKKARELVAQRCAGPRGKLGLVSGKELLSRLSTWAQATYGTSFGANSLIRAIRRDEVDAELEQLVLAVSEGRRLQPH